MLQDGTIYNAAATPTATMGPLSFGELYREVAPMCSDEVSIASAICSRLQLTTRQREVLWALVLEQCRMIARNEVRRLEKVAKPHRVGQPADTAMERQQVMAETFTPGDGRRVLWGEATIADHEMRIAYLKKMRGGIDATMQRHEEAIKLLRASGATCLNDLQGASK
jgi:hypothetical protein